VRINITAEKKSVRRKREREQAGKWSRRPSINRLEGRKGGGESPIRLESRTWTMKMQGIPTILPPAERSEGRRGERRANQRRAIQWRVPQEEDRYTLHSSQRQQEALEA
jgi:hypothetical protein